MPSIVPSSHHERQGAYFDAQDRSGPYAVDSAGNATLMNSLSSLLSGESQQFNRLMGGAVVKKKLMSADGIVTGGPAILYAIKVKTAGTSIDVHDDASGTTGDKVIDAEGTATAGALIYPAGPGVGVLMDLGIYLNLTLGTYWVFYVDAA